MSEILWWNWLFLDFIWWKISSAHDLENTFYTMNTVVITLTLRVTICVLVASLMLLTLKAQSQFPCFSNVCLKKDLIALHRICFQLSVHLLPVCRIYTELIYWSAKEMIILWVWFKQSEGYSRLNYLSRYRLTSLLFDIWRCFWLWHILGLFFNRVCMFVCNIFVG